MRLRLHISKDILRRYIQKTNSFYFYLPRFTLFFVNWINFLHHSKTKNKSLIFILKPKNQLFNYNWVNLTKDYPTTALCEFIFRVTRLLKFWSQIAFVVFYFIFGVYKTKIKNREKMYHIFNTLLLINQKQLTLNTYKTYIASNKYLCLQYRYSMFYQNKKLVFNWLIERSANGLSYLIFWSFKCSLINFVSANSKILISIADGVLPFKLDLAETWRWFVKDVYALKTGYKYWFKITKIITSILSPLFQNFNLYYHKFSKNPLLLKKYLAIIYQYERLLINIRQTRLLSINKIWDKSFLLFAFFFSLDIKHTPVSNLVVNKYRTLKVIRPLLNFTHVTRNQRVVYFTNLTRFLKRFYLRKSKKTLLKNFNGIKYFQKLWLIGLVGVKLLKLTKFVFKKYYFNLHQLTLPTTLKKKIKLSTLNSNNVKNKKQPFFFNIYTHNIYYTKSFWFNYSHYFVIKKNIQALFNHQKQLRLAFLKFANQYIDSKTKKMHIFYLSTKMLIFRYRRRDYVRNVCFFVLKKIYKRFLKNGHKNLAQKFFINFLQDFKYSYNKSVYNIFFNFITKIKRGATVRPMFKSGITYQIPFALTFSKYIYFTLVYLLNQIKNDMNLTKCYTALKEILIIYTKQKVKTNQFSKKVYFKSHLFNNKMLKYCKYIKTNQSYLYTMFPF